MSAPTDKEEGKRGANRVTPEGRELGAHLCRMTEPEITKLALADEPDERCKSCAFRAGTVPNGCVQTQADAIKAVLENVPFYCHATDPIGTKVCWGWFAARQAVKNEPPQKCPWPFSDPDPVKS